MIHAFLVFTNPRACMYKGGNCNEFKDIMERINAITDLNITVSIVLLMMSILAENMCGDAMGLAGCSLLFIDMSGGL